MTLLLTYLFLALVVSFICSVTEAVLLSTPVSHLRVLKQKGSKSAAMLIDFRQNIDKPISAILTLNTFAHTIGAAGVGVQASEVFGEEYFGIVSAALTILILVLTEIFPKTIGANYNKELAGLIAHIIRIMIFISYPFVVVSAFLTKLLSKRENGKTVSREELSALAAIGTEEGVFGEKENRIIQNLIKLKGIKVEEVMTPRVVMSAANEEMDLEEFLSNKDYLHYSRIPVYSGSSEEVTGYVFRQKVFEKLAEDHEGLKLRDIKREIVVVHDKQPLFSVWEVLLEKKEHIALVIDEYGGVAGIVTMEDLIETLLGIEILDEKDKVGDMQMFARERWEMRQKKYDYLDNYRK